MDKPSAAAASIVAILASVFVSIPAFGQANQAQLPDPGILPDSPIYGLKRAFESIVTDLTFGDDTRSLRALDIAQIRLAEAMAMTNSEKHAYVPSLLYQYTTELDKANTLAGSLPNGTRSVVYEKIAEVISRHVLAFDEMTDKGPESSKLAIESAQESSIKENIKALNNLATENPERAEAIATRISDAKLHSAFKGKEDGDQKEIDQALRDKKKYDNLIDQIKTKSKQTQKEDSDSQKGDDDQKTANNDKNKK